MILLSPSTTLASSSGAIRPTASPMRSTERVRIRLIFTHDFFGRVVDSIGSVSGKPAFGGWLVNAVAITVPDRVLKTSWLRISTGRRPGCALPLVGFSSAQRISPLNIPAIRRAPRPCPLQPSFSLQRDRVLRTPRQVLSVPCVPVFHRVPPQSPGFDL